MKQNPPKSPTQVASPLATTPAQDILPSSSPHDPIKILHDIDPEETNEWQQSIADVIRRDGTERAAFLLQTMQHELPQLTAEPWVAAIEAETTHTPTTITPYVNTITLPEEKPYPGDLSLERSITAAVRWNAMAMVLRANHRSAGIGGHIATFASCATIYEVAYNHFLKGPNATSKGDSVFFQGHTSPGVYARAFIEGALSEKQIENFRRELLDAGGLPSYPHPRLTKNFWQFATVSMGLGPLMAIYHARFAKWLSNRNLKDTLDNKIIAYVGDGETDEVDTIGGLSIAARENLDNLIFVVNCNLQRLDGPVRGNSKIIQELESIFTGAGWNVIKVVWSHHWDKLFAQDKTGALTKLLESAVDGDFQLFTTFTGAERRRNFFARDKTVAQLIKNLSDEELEELTFGGHDEGKLYNAYDRAFHTSNGKPSVLLVKSIKGFGMGKSGEGRNIAHQQKSMSSESLHDFKIRFKIPIEDERLEETPFYHFKEASQEMQYLKKLRLKLGAFLPQRSEEMPKIDMPDDKIYDRSFNGTGKREISSTMAFVSILTALLRDANTSQRIVPIVPDESRTFGMEGLFRQFGIYAPKGQLYTPVDKQTLAPYKESRDGQIFQEGINEAGAISTFIAAGTSYSHQGVVTIPFYVFYSMFGFQRTGDFAWAAADMKVRGFLIGGTAGRTTLNGEGLQHEDGHSHVLASTIPNIRAYDPAFGYEIAVIIQDGIKAMYEQGADIFYYITIYNENYPHPKLPQDIPHIKEKILKGMYRLRSSALTEKKSKGRAVNILASGISVLAALRAAPLLEERYQVAVNIYSVTSFKSLREDALATARTNMLAPDAKEKLSFLATCLKDAKGSFVAVTDYMKSLPDSIAPFLPSEMITLGTDGFGRSSSRDELREYFEINESYIILASLYSLYKRNEFTKEDFLKARTDLGIDPKKVSPLDAV